MNADLEKMCNNIDRLWWEYKLAQPTEKQFILS